MDHKLAMVDTNDRKVVNLHEVPTMQNDMQYVDGRNQSMVDGGGLYYVSCNTDRGVHTLVDTPAGMVIVIPIQEL